MSNIPGLKVEIRAENLDIMVKMENFVPITASILLLTNSPPLVGWMLVLGLVINFYIGRDSLHVAAPVALEDTTTVTRIDRIRDLSKSISVGYTMRF
jgi:hypothetical protein